MSIEPMGLSASVYIVEDDGVTIECHRMNGDDKIALEIKGKMTDVFITASVGVMEKIEAMIGIALVVASKK